MQCPEPGCGGETEVLRTKRNRYGLIVQRRRRCLACGQRFNTREIITPEKVRQEVADRNGPGATRSAEPYLSPDLAGPARKP